MEKKRILKASQFDTPLGPMLAIGDDENLYVLEFMERKGLEKELVRFQQKTQATIISGKTNPIDLIQKELHQYFHCQLSQFTTPLFLIGTDFQKQVWNALKQIPCGETRSYTDIAVVIGKPSAFRAVALANSMNQLAIIIPCHRVINKNQSLGGYAGGLSRKEWLLIHESRLKQKNGENRKGAKKQAI